MALDLKQLVIEEFSESATQSFYAGKALEGFWLGEDEMIRKHFIHHSGRVLDLGCGTGRTSIPLHQMGFDVTGVDLVPAMIEQAKAIAKKSHLNIAYETGDATTLNFEEGSFDYVLFSNQGWTQIPGQNNRMQALNEIYRVLKKNGVFIFTAHPRSFNREFGLFWTKQWIRFHILNPLGLKIPEQDFGDRLFERVTDNGNTTYQYIHIPAIHEVEKAVEQAGFNMIEVNTTLQISERDIRRHPPVFYVCRK